jgi:hypothetical protein
MIFLNRITFEHTLYLFALALALFVRLLQLGAAPLSDFEAAWALQARAVAVGESSAVGANPAYVLLTGLLFNLFGITNFLARFWPALAVSLVALLPIGFRAYIGRTAAIVLAFGIALDPGLAAISRIAGGPGMALGFGVLALACFVLRQPAWVGIFAGLALLSGPYFVHGIIILLIAWVLAILLDRIASSNILVYDGHENGRDAASFEFRKSFYWLLGTVLLVGTSFFWVSQGIGGLASILPSYMGSWLQPSGIPVLRLPAALLVYQPLIILFGLLGAVRSWRGSRRQALLGKWFSLWAVSALVLSLIFPGRQVWDLGWALVPLLGLAAIEITHLLTLRPPVHSRWISVTQAVFVLSLLSFSWIQLSAAGTVRTYEIYPDLPTYLLLILGAFIMIVLTTLLVGLGWSWTTTRLGFMWGLGAALLLYMISALWGSAHLRMNRVVELWNPLPGVGQAHLLGATLNDLSSWRTGYTHQLDVMSLAPSPSLQWYLLDWETRFVRDIPVGELPSAIITFEGHENPALAAAYRGQSFVWTEVPAWTGVLPQNWPRWITNRDAPLLDTRVILWVRSDIFPGGTIEADIENNFDLDVDPLFMEEGQG